MEQWATVLSLCDPPPEPGPATAPKLRFSATRLPLSWYHPRPLSKMVSPSLPSHLGPPLPWRPRPPPRSSSGTSVVARHPPKAILCIPLYRILTALYLGPLLSLASLEESAEIENARGSLSSASSRAPRYGGRNGVAEVAVVPAPLPSATGGSLHSSLLAVLRPATPEASLDCRIMKRH